ncbi:MAG: VirK/YbjX family protein [Gammaproteobacteria bacterium]|nr:VirK/YbjX family protein [Gammaproteobacteria bacterium]
MSIGLIETLVRVYQLGKLMHPDLNLNSAKHRVILLTRAVIFYPVIRDWYAISDNPLLTRALQRFPMMSGAMYWPYINHVWPMQRRLAVIEQHYRMLGGPAAIIAHATFEEIEVARLEAEYPGLRVVLDKAMWFLREGEIVLNLFVNDQRFYSLAFTLGNDDTGQPIVLVGALQGSNSDAAQDVYRNITHTLHGMRPRDLLMVAFKLLCTELGIDRVWAVSSDNRQHNSPYFGNSHKEKVLVAYNEVWQEHGGTELDSGFFEIPTAVKYKDMAEIPSRKRAAYRRRYEMLDRLALDIKNSCEQHAAQTTGNAAAS